MTAGLAGQSVIDGTDQDGTREGQEQLKDTSAEIIEVPAGLAEEAMKGAEVLELGQIAGLNDAGERAASATENPRASHGPEGTETGLSKARLARHQ
jgi:hypothetical protein